MTMRHLSQHGSSPEGDALDLWETQDKVLLALFDEWESTSVDQWDHGTTGKLLLEHTAVREGALEETARALSRLGESDEAAKLMADGAQRREILDQLDGQSVGREPAAIAASVPFADAVSSLQSRLRKDIERDLADTFPRIRQLMGEEARGHELRSAHYVRKHAPSHPNPNRHWYNQLRVVNRLHTIYDRLRGFPWPESKPFMDDELAEKYDQEG